MTTRPNKGGTNKPNKESDGSIYKGQRHKPMKNMGGGVGGAFLPY